MISRKLGSSPYISFLVKVGGKPASIQSARAEIQKNDKPIINLNATIKRNRVSIVVPSSAITSIGDYMAVFDVQLEDMGSEPYAVPFKITKSPLGKKRINAY